MTKLSKKALFVKRSAAAKRGWATRKANDNAKRKVSQKKSVSVSKKTKPVTRGSKKPSQRQPVKPVRAAPKTRKKPATKPRSVAKSATRKPKKSDSKTREITRLRAELARARTEAVEYRKKALRAATKQRKAAANERALETRRAKRRESRERTAIRKANAKALKSLHAFEVTVANMARNNVPVSKILVQVPKTDEAQNHAKRIIIQTRLDMAAKLFDDVRFEAFDLADDLDWDISDVFDAWEYDAEGAA